MANSIPPLDLAWGQINALGGTADNSYDQGFVDAIGKALEVIEKLGGKDPLHQRAYERRMHNIKHPLPVTFE